MNRTSSLRLIAALLYGTIATSTALGQSSESAQYPTRDQANATTAAEQPERPSTPPPPIEPYLLRPGHYVLPGPYDPTYWSPHLRPFPDYSTHRQLPRRTAAAERYRYFRTPRGAYYPGYRDDCPPPNSYYGRSPYSGIYWTDVRDAYEQGRYDADHEYVWYIASQRAGGLLNQHRELFEQALIQFRKGRYDWAAIKLLGAAEKNHANAGSRLHAGHALFALGRYDDATKLVVRAFELSPSLITRQYDVREEYGDSADFDRQLARLRSYVAARPNEAAPLTLLGYITFYTEGPGAAYPYLQRAAQLDRDSYFIPKLLPLARAASGMEPPPPKNDKPTDQQVSPPPPTAPENGTATPATPSKAPTRKDGGGGAVDENVIRQVKT